MFVFMLSKMNFFSPQLKLAIRAKPAEMCLPMLDSILALFSYKALRVSFGLNSVTICVIWIIKERGHQPSTFMLGREFTVTLSQLFNLEYSVYFNWFKVISIYLINCADLPPSYLWDLFIYPYLNVHFYKLP